MRRVYPPAAYKRVASLLREHIQEGLYLPGEKLPTIVRLAALYDVKPGTAFTAYQLLGEEGLVVGRPRDGYYVSDVPRETSGEA